MFQRFIDNSKNVFFIDFFIYLSPFAIIAGQSAINIVTILIPIFFLFLIYQKKKYREFKSYFIFLFFLILFFLVNIIFSVDIYLSTKAILGLIRYYIMFLAILYCLNNIEDFRYNLTRIIFIALSFVVLDSFIQYFFHKDIFLKEIIDNRLTGPFDRKVPGAYVSKLFFISLIFLSVKKINIRYIFFLLGITLIFLLLTNERSSTFVFFFSLLIFICFCNLKNYLKLALLILIPTLVFLVINYNIQLKNRFVEQTRNHITEDNYWAPHFLTAIEIFKNKKIMGNGVKTFRIECKKEKYSRIKTKYIDMRCSTHPHNIYLEILSETGILGILILLTINMYIFVYLIINFFQKKNYKTEILFIFCNFFILFWPIQSTGAFFSTWNGFFYWIFFAFFFNLKIRLDKLI